MKSLNRLSQETINELLKTVNFILEEHTKLKVLLEDEKFKSLEFSYLEAKKDLEVIKHTLGIFASKN